MQLAFYLIQTKTMVGVYYVDAVRGVSILGRDGSVENVIQKLERSQGRR